MRTDSDTGCQSPGTGRGCPLGEASWIPEGHEEERNAGDIDRVTTFPVAGLPT